MLVRVTLLDWDIQIEKIYTHGMISKLQKMASTFKMVVWGYDIAKRLSSKALHMNERGIKDEGNIENLPRIVRISYVNS